MEIDVKEFGVRIRLFVEQDTDAADTDESPKMDCHACGAEAYLVISREEVKLYCNGPDGCDSAYRLDPPSWTRGFLKKVQEQRPLGTLIETALRTWRRDEAIRRGIPTYIVMTERVIQEIKDNTPRNLDELAKVKGVGPKTIEIYGERLMEIIWEVSNSEEE